MNITFISKYPPIQGGESSKVYWLAKSLGERGHSVSVISNCMEVEEMYRCQLDDSDKEKLQPKNVKLYSSVPLKVPKFIPANNPFGEKLVSLALQSEKDINSDIIFGWYLLPYCTAAYSSSKLLDKKYIVKHAGSDLTRLFHDPFLNPFLERVLTDAKGILTSKRLEKFFEELKCENIFTESYNFPEEFNPFGERIDFRRDFGLDINPDKTLLFLGKVSKPKGLGYLIDSFAGTSKENYLVVAGNGPDKEYCENRVKELNLEERVNFIGVLTPWKIPSLIRSVKSVVVPEHNFGVPIHKSGIPYESLLCGANLILSEQLRGKYKDPAGRIRFVNPTDEKEFSRTIEEVINTKKEDVKKGYNRLRKVIGNHTSYVEKIENYLLKVASS